MINAVVIDDEEKSRKVLIRLINEVSKDVKVVGEASSVQDGFTVITNLNPDLIFLDVEMLDGTGFNLLEKFNKINFDIIFTTAYDQYAIRAFKYSAVDYLLKPINVDELEEAIKKISKLGKGNKIIDKLFLENLLLNLNQLSTTKRITINGANTINYVYVSDILYCSSSLSATEIYLYDKSKILAVKSLKEYEEYIS
ncbi:MAG: LytR/AlgR family response regulator transcription factor [Flavobacteriales bacterium]